MFTVFSALDDRARPKGSRDPLGAEAIWSFMGRKIVGNLTTVTGSLDNFMVALLCCEFANSAANDADVQEHYLRFEQLAAYLKLCVRPRNDGILGITRARANFANPPVYLGTAKTAQLLADQASYGLWGLYSSALESVGLIQDEHRRPTTAGKELITQIIAKLGEKNWETLCTLAQRDRLEPAPVAKLAPAFCAMLSNETLRAVTVEALLARQKDCRLQSELFVLMQNYLDEANDDATEPSIEAFCHWLLDPGAATKDMQAVIGRIRDLDPVLRRADMVMSWLQGKADTSMTDLASTLAPYLKGIAPEASWSDLGDLPYRSFLEEFHGACASGDADAVIRAVLAQNKRVMTARGGAAWLDVDAGHSLVVRVRNDRSSGLDSLGEDAGPWRYTYFIGSFLAICRQGRA
jgi:hypothetical protein